MFIFQRFVKLFTTQNGVYSLYRADTNMCTFGNKGFIEWNSQFNRTNTITLYDANGIQIENFVANYEYEGFEYEVNEVEKSIREGKTESCLVSLFETHNTMYIINHLNG